MDSRPDAGGTPARRLVVMRHADAEQGARTDAERRLTQRGWEQASAAGEWLGRQRLRPDRVLVSSATRAQETWAAVAEAAGLTGVETDVSRAMYGADPDSALDLIREQPDDVRTLLAVGHNPTMASLAFLLDDGEGDTEAERAMSEASFPPASIAVFDLRTWSGLDEMCARLVAYRNGRS